MSENLFADDNNELEKETIEVKKDFKGLLGSVRKFLSELVEIRSNTDATATKESIIADIPFKGHTSWILVCSIFIASVGLNANSTAVVIGAMLISPLMGPILGMGMSLAINDIDTLRRSVKNLVVMVVLSVLAAYLFFAFFPLRDESSELLARTKPDIRDVLIAFFGGLALVIARARKGTIASVIFGVAIATALMPNASYLKRNVNVEYNPDGESKIELFAFGDQQITDETIALLNARLKDYSGLKNTKVSTNYSGNKSVGELRFMQELRERDSLDLVSQSRQISYLKDRLQQLERLEKHTIPFQEISSEAKVNYEDLAAIGFAYRIQTDFNKQDTVPVFEVKWKQNLNAVEIEQRQKKLSDWLKLRLQDDKIQVKQVEN